MAMFRLQIKAVSRKAGRRATAAAAYRAGERVRDEQTGELHNYSRRKDVLHTEIFLPSKLDTVPLEWARDRASLWNIAERTEKRRDANVAREYQVVLPFELTPSGRLSLARSFSRELAERYGVAVDLAIHEPRPGSDPRNFHAHLLTTTREVLPDGLGAKAGLDMQRGARAERGLPNHSEEYGAVRERWAALTNEALREANIESRVDHRSLAAQGIDREPVPRIPIAAYRMEKNGVRSAVAERLREDYRARVQAREERATVRAGERARTEKAALPVEEGVAYPKNIEDIGRQAVRAWLRYRQEEARRSPEQDKSPGRDRDHAQQRERNGNSQREHEDRGNEEGAVTRGRDNDYGL
jgi:ATP-dependent exoDNAse (exonuclease V) alpha subunit